MPSTMKEFVQYLVETIAKHPEAVSVAEQQIDTTYIRELVTVHPEDMGLVIGKSGRTIQSVRELAKAKAIKDGVKVDVELVEPNRKPMDRTDRRSNHFDRGRGDQYSNSSVNSEPISSEPVSEEQINEEVEKMAADLDSGNLSSDDLGDMN